MVKVAESPAHVIPPFVRLENTFIVAVMGVVPALVAVNAGILPVPLAPRPIPVLLFVQVYTAPDTGPLTVVAATEDPAHITLLAMAFTVAVGLTVIVNDLGVPTQLVPPFVNVAITVIVAIKGAVPLFVVVNAAMFPVPFAPRPIEVLLFVQLKTILLPAPPEAVLLKVIAVDDVALHNTWLVTAVTVAVGLTVIVNVIGIPTQLIPPLVKVGVTAMVSIIGNKPALVAVKDGMFPVPLAAMPMARPVLTQS